MPAQHRLVGQQAPHRCEQRAVAGRDRRRARRQAQREHDGDRGVRERGQHVEPAPAGRARDQARERPGQQDAEHQPAHHVADRAAALRLGRHRRGHRHEHLDHARRGAGHERRQQEYGAGPRERGQRERDCARGQRRDDQAAVLEQVDERDEQHEPGGVAELRQHRDEAGQAGRQVQVGADRARQRLRGEQVHHDHADRRGEEHRHTRAERGRRAGGRADGRASGGGARVGRAVHRKPGEWVEGVPIVGVGCLCDN
ncbi:hypothetical protein BLA6863_07289 [Burkholderia lata]|uniref:Uncharacterized protein n=1 Tax=Burkholderia lata (strain ATCC 17760 / DSM 23089 / LMG 22485 / NCIMB 9086 / R18194 / 383) TaxID=482957 RepID=A0A6P2S5V4_BURL3|nr:hypothetical protein BLA6863_07289 [Burkholderia lata]